MRGDTATIMACHWSTRISQVTASCRLRNPYSQAEVMREYRQRKALVSQAAESADER